MCRWLASCPEVARGPHDSLPEMAQPHSIRNYARSQGIIRRDNCISKIEPAVTIFKRLALLSGDAKKKAARHGLAGSLLVAAQKYARVLGGRIVCKHKCVRW